MKESLRVKYPDLLLKTAKLEVNFIRTNLWEEFKRIIHKLKEYVPAEAITFLVGMKALTYSTNNSLVWLPYVGMILFLLLRLLSTNFKSEDRPYDINGFLAVISVLAYVLWNSALAVFFFLCTLLLTTLG
ncbi:hypothetical protein [Reichenbachiella sp.]|uniref:hypothetical protein n=1 Tax=Reichenbachiella sp. TaxID=2184521 RepID=UPI003B5A9B7E